MIDVYSDLSQAKCIVILFECLKKHMHDQKEIQVNTTDLLRKYFPDEFAFNIISEHSRLVADKALAVARCLNEQVDTLFLEEAALLHDIGICRTAAVNLGCFGQDPYITHGIHGRSILEAEGLPRHALVCERHIGVGLTIEDVIVQRLPLPHRPMAPTCIEEEIICFADLFYSKKGSRSGEKNIESIRSGLRIFGDHKCSIFDGWLERFKVPGL